MIRIAKLYQPALMLLLLLMFPGQAAADCNVCQKNGAACINSTSYYMCFGDPTPHTEQLFHCPAGLDCTDFTAICLQKSSQRPPSCGDTAQCGLCSAHRNYLFACRSRSVFQMCNGATKPTGVYGRCPKDYVCDAGSDAICVPQAQVVELTCDVADELVETTTASTTESTTESGPGGNTEASPGDPMTVLEVCELHRKTGLYHTVPQDPACLRYVYCYYKNGVVKSAEYKCEAKTYFETEKQGCTTTKPKNCI